MNPILLGQQVQETIRELVRSTLNCSGAAFEGTVDRFLAEPQNLLKGPWVSMAMPFRQDASGTGTTLFPDIPLGFVPYEHQVQAFERLSGEFPGSTLITTGTGSGKTESYLWPILEHCRRTRGQPGIKAVVIYPMNALANDQARRIAAVIDRTPALADVRAGLYADVEPQFPLSAMTPEGVITKRGAMQEHPPDILLTNYKMLDYLLIRGTDRALWQHNEPETLRYLVVDELHTFDGAQGTDLALLIRRLKYRLGVSPNRLLCVGASATLGSGPETAGKLREHAEQIFGEPFDEGSVVQEIRSEPHENLRSAEYLDWPDPSLLRSILLEAGGMDQPALARELAKCLFAEARDHDARALMSGDPKDAEWRVLLGRLLLEHQLCHRLLRIICSQTKPWNLEDIAAEMGKAKALQQWNQADCRNLVVMFVSLVSWARSGTPDKLQPLFPVRVQFWIRELTRMVASLPDTGGSQIDLYHAGDLEPADLGKSLPVAVCNRCGAGAHIGVQSPSSRSYGAQLEDIYPIFFDDRQSGHLRLFYHDRIESHLSGPKNRVIPGLLDSQTLIFEPDDKPDPPESDTKSRVWLYNPTGQDGRIDRACPACGHAQSLLLFGVRAARMTASLSSALYTSEQNEEKHGSKPRLLMFSDSVQDAAQRAAVTETRSARTTVQKSLFATLNEGDMNLQEVVEDLPARLLEEMGSNDFSGCFIAKDQTWRREYEKLFAYGSPVSDPAFLKDVKLRLGWKYISDLTFRSHLAHTLEANGVAVADVSVDTLTDTVDRLFRRLHNDFPALELTTPEMLVPFLAGLLQHMRRIGSVGHRYIVEAVKAGPRNDGSPNYFAAGNKLKIDKTRALPVPNRRFNMTPQVLTLHGSAPEMSTIAKGGPSNWWHDWLFRNLQRDGKGFGIPPEEIYTDVLERLVLDGLIERVSRSGVIGRDGYLLKLEQVTVSADVAHFRCNRCRRRAIALADNGFAEGMPCARLGCEGNLEAEREWPRPEFRRALATRRNHRVIAREHTGLLEANTRRQVEESFMAEDNSWSTNLISSTPTLELGIDIGDLSTVLLCQVPPEVANYVQRIGRSGRRDGNSLNLTIATARPHDRQFWEDPDAMLSETVSPPGVHLAAEAVLLRQVTAFTLDRYVATGSRTEDYGDVRGILRKLDDPQSTDFPGAWLEMVRKNGPALCEEFLEMLPEDIRARNSIQERIGNWLTKDDYRSLPWAVQKVFDRAKADRERLIGVRKQLNDDLKRLRGHRTELTDKEFQSRQEELTRERNAINRLISDRIDRKSVLSFLTEQGMLPNYAFPEEGVSLTSILTGRDQAQGDLLSFEYVRSASAALSEFAPGQDFYANDRQVKVEELELPPPPLPVWKFCQRCSHVEERSSGNDSDTCPKCDDPMWSDPGTDRYVMPMHSVVSITKERDATIREADQRIERRYDREVIPFHHPDQTETAWCINQLDSGAPFGYEFINLCSMREFNFGQRVNATSNTRIAGKNRHSYPFRICRHCGMAQKHHESNDHRRRCPVNASPDMSRKEWEIETFLTRSFDTEAVRIVIPVIGTAQVDDIKSFVAGINVGLRRHFAGKVDHIRPAIVETRLRDEAVVRSLYLYDNVPGGTGYLRQLSERPQDMQSVIRQATEVLRDCPCNQEEKNGCFRCVKSWREQFGPGEPDRDRALSLLETILSNWDKLRPSEDGIDKTIFDSLVDSKLEQNFLQKLETTFGSDSLKAQVMPGGSRGFVLKIPTGSDPLIWNIEAQVQINKRFPRMPVKRVDFLLTPVGQRARKPIVVEMDGYKYHADQVDKDLEDRLTMIRSGHVGVWSLSWNDIEKEDNTAFTNPLAVRCLPPDSLKALTKLKAMERFADLGETVQALQEEDSFFVLKRVLEGGDGLQSAALSLLLRCIVGPGRPFDDLPRADRVGPEGSEHLEGAPLHGHIADVNDNSIDLYMSCDKITRLDTWRNQTDDIRALLRWDPKTGPEAENPGMLGAWRGLWRLVNLLQDLRGFHVDYEGLETLSPPDMQSGGIRGEDSRWDEVRDLCDEAWHPLVEAMIAAEIDPPDLVGSDLMEEGRVIGMAELIWSEARVAVCEEDLRCSGYTVVAFDPDTDRITDALGSVLEALGKQGS